MYRAAVYGILGYLSGSILYANVFGGLFGKRDRLEQSADKNPGTANAFLYCGFWCGLLTLLCDLLKGFLPVFLYLRTAPLQRNWWLALVLAGPVIGHCFPVFYRFQGGKGIAVTFGCLLGLLPYRAPAAFLAAMFVFFSLGLRVTPHYYRTLVSYLTALAVMWAGGVYPAVRMGFMCITGVVCLRLHLSREEKKKPQIRLLWMH